MARQSEISRLNNRRRTTQQPSLPVAPNIVRNITTACDKLQKDEEQAVLFFSRPMVSSQACSSTVTSSNISIMDRRDMHRSAQQIQRVQNYKYPKVNKSSRIEAESTANFSTIQTGY